MLPKILRYALVALLLTACSTAGSQANPPLPPATATPLGFDAQQLLDAWTAAGLDASAPTPLAVEELAISALSLTDAPAGTLVHLDQVCAGCTARILTLANSHDFYAYRTHLTEQVTRDEFDWVFSSRAALAIVALDGRMSLEQVRGYRESFAATFGLEDVMLAANPATPLGSVSTPAPTDAAPAPTDAVGTGPTVSALIGLAQPAESAAYAVDANPALKAMLAEIHSAIPALTVLGVETYVTTSPPQALQGFFTDQLEGMGWEITKGGAGDGMLGLVFARTEAGEEQQLYMALIDLSVLDPTETGTVIDLTLIK